MTDHSSQPAIHLMELADDDLPSWLQRMEAAFAAGIRDAGLQPGDQPIPKADDMDEALHAPGTELLQVIRGTEIVGGAAIGTERNGCRSLELFFIDDGRQGGGTGVLAWESIEARYPDTEVWETETPYFDQRNIHFYINRCGFHAVEFFHPGHRPARGGNNDHDGPDRMLRFEKRMSQ